MNTYLLIAAHGHAVKDTDPRLVIISLFMGAVMFALFCVLFPKKNKDE